MLMVLRVNPLESSHSITGGIGAGVRRQDGIAGITPPIARDLARSVIDNLTIAPGIVRTPMLSGMAEEAQKALAAAVPCPGRVAAAADAGKLVR
jgi:NAD(P)-dependent dehydrogenase (short-subunit alcohol dehydrogenase family)